MDDRWTTHAGGVCELRYHFVWCPKYRRPVLVGAVRDRLLEVLSETCNDLKLDITRVEVMPDHVHLVLRVSSPHLSPAQIAFRLKGRSSHVLRGEFPSLKSRLPTLWSRSYYVGTVGQASTRTIERYIELQRGR